MTEKVYRMAGVDIAMQLLRPGASFQMSNSEFIEWNDPRPMPTWQEILETVEKIRAFEDSINTIYLEDTNQ